MLKRKAFTQFRKLSFFRIVRINNFPTKKFRVNKILAHVSRCVLVDSAVTFPPRFWNTSETSDSRTSSTEVLASIWTSHSHIMGKPLKHPHNFNHENRQLIKA
jgi:hypothetical protein